jgi:hypothetical protein
MDRQQLISLKLQHFFSGDNTERTEEQRKRSEEILSLLQQETDRRDGKTSAPEEEKAPNVLNAHHARMKERARLAQERINAKYGSGGNTLNSGIPLDLMADLTVVGYTKILDGVADFKAWSEEVLAEQKPELRDRIRRWLPGVFAQAQHIHSLPDDEADAFIDELLIDAHGEIPDAEMAKPELKQEQPKQEEKQPIPPGKIKVGMYVVNDGKTHYVGGVFNKGLPGESIVLQDVDPDKRSSKGAGAVAFLKEIEAIVPDPNQLKKEEEKPKELSNDRVELAQQIWDLQRSWPKSEHNRAEWDAHHQKIRALQRKLGSLLTKEEAMRLVARQQIFRKHKLQELIRNGDDQEAYKEYLHNFANSGFSGTIAGFTMYTSAKGFIDVDGWDTRIEVGPKAMFDVVVNELKKNDLVDENTPFAHVHDVLKTIAAFDTEKQGTKQESLPKKQINSDWAEYKAKHNLPPIMDDPNNLSTDDLEYIVEHASDEWMMHVDKKYKNLYKKYAEKRKVRIR